MQDTQYVYKSGAGGNAVMVPIEEEIDYLKHRLAELEAAKASGRS